MSKKRLISLPKAIADKMGVYEGMKLKMYIESDKMIIEPIRDTFWYALHGSRLGYIGFRELEEESDVNKRKIQNFT